MFTVDELIRFYEGAYWDQPTPSGMDEKDICLSTVTYLSAYKTCQQMLLNLANPTPKISTKAGETGG